jgi:hypothetical protein
MYNQAMKCAVRGVQSDPARHIVFITLPPQNKPSMSGTIRFAETVDADVAQIHIIYEGRPEITVYFKDEGSHWDSRTFVPKEVSA